MKRINLKKAAIYQQDVLEIASAGLYINVNI